MNNEEILAYLKDNRKQIDDALSTLTESELRFFLNDYEIMGKLYSYLREQSDGEAFVRFLSFRIMFNIDYDNIGSWTQKCKNWKSKYEYYMRKISL